MDKRMIILFDLDGTLIDSTECILTSFEYAFDTLGTPRPTRELIKAQIGYPLDMMFEKVGAEKSLVWDFVTAYKSKYRDISLEGTSLIEGAREAVELASSFARLGVVTTKTSRYSQELLENMGVMGYFETLIGREDVENPKPHPEPIYKALKAMDLEAHDKRHIWMIGDTMMDIEAANAAGVRHVGVFTGYGEPKTLIAGCELTADNALEAIRLIKAMA
jgi:phosphoglycolate phosphatase